MEQLAADTARRLRENGIEPQTFSGREQSVAGWEIYSKMNSHSSKGNATPWFAYSSKEVGILAVNGELWVLTEAWGYHDDHPGGVVNQKYLGEEARHMIPRVGHKRLSDFLRRM